METINAVYFLDACLYACLYSGLFGSMGVRVPGCSSAWTSGEAAVTVS